MALTTAAAKVRYEETWMCKVSNGKVCGTGAQTATCTVCGEEHTYSFLGDTLGLLVAFCTKHRHEEPKKMGYGQVDTPSFITSSVQVRFDVNQELILAIAKASNFNVNYQQNGAQFRLICSKCQAVFYPTLALRQSDLEDNTTPAAAFCSTHAHRITAPILADGRKFREDEP